MKRRMQRNLVLLFLGSSAVPLAVVAGIGYYVSTRSIVSMVRRRAAFSCKEIDRRFTRRMRRVEDQFQLVAGGGGTLPGEWEARARLRDGRAEFYVEDLVLEAGLDRRFTRLVILDADGAPRYKIDYRRVPVRGPGGPRYFLQTARFRPEDARGYEEAARLGPSETRVLLPGPDAGTMVIRLATPLFSGRRRLGTLLADFDAAGILESVIGGMSLGKDAFHFLVDSRSGVLLSHPDYSRRNQLLAVAMPSLGPDFLGGRADGWARFRDAGGQEWIVSRRRLAGTPWVVAVAGPLGSFLAPIQRVGRLLLLLVLFVLTGASLVILLATRRFRRSLASLTAAAQSFSSGDLSRRVEVRSDDEMGALGRTLNSMARDLRREIERREQSARIESFNRLAAAVAHDLKSSLFSLSLLLDNLDRHAGERQFMKDSALTIRKALEKLKKTSERLACPPSGAAVRLEPLELSSLLRAALDESGAGRRPGLRVEADLPEGVSALGEREETGRLFLNLVQNAVEAMPGGGTLRLSCRRVEDRAGGAAWAEVTVEDSGAGMSSDFLRRRLYRPFASTKAGGIGLGLYTCREIVERHGGRIEVRSEPARGSVFHVRLPAPAARATHA
ncbi:MAG: ATP-binding protein [Acidobacteriota bacterium]